LKTLICLDLSHNPLSSLPVEISRLKYLKHLKLDDISFEPLAEPATLLSAQSSFTSLKELAARVIVQQQIPIWQDSHQELKDYLLSSHACSFCTGPYFDSYVSKIGIVRRNETDIPIEHRLCREHWKTDSERLKLMFCPPINVPKPAKTKGRTSGGKTYPTTIPLSAITPTPSLPVLATSRKSGLFQRMSHSSSKEIGAGSGSGVLMQYISGSIGHPTLL
jgi:hypothetical protein